MSASERLIAPRRQRCLIATMKYNGSKSSATNTAPIAAGDAFAGAAMCQVGDANASDDDMLDCLRLLADSDDAAANNDSAPADARNPAPIQNFTLQATSDRYHPEEMHRDMRAKSACSESAFNTHQLNNTDLIFYIYENQSNMLCDDFRHELEGIDRTIDYYYYDNASHRDTWRANLLREAISDALGPYGMKPAKMTVDFAAFTADVTTYMGYVRAKEKCDGGTTQCDEGRRGGCNSSLVYLFWRYGYNLVYILRREYERDLYEGELEEYMDAMACLVCDGGGDITEGSTALPGFDFADDDGGGSAVLFLHPDGKSRRIPDEWDFPDLGLQPMYVLWHCGNPSERISPIKMLTQNDLSPLGKKGLNTFVYLKRVMNAIDKAASAGNIPPQKYMSQAQATSCFFAYAGRFRDVGDINKLSWRTAVKYMTKKYGY